MGQNWIIKSRLYGNENLLSTITRGLIEAVIFERLSNKIKAELLLG